MEAPLIPEQTLAILRKMFDPPQPKPKTESENEKEK
nr:MAG TPA: hypothetical protein [Caudoviricetes sp.]